MIFFNAIFFTRNIVDIEKKLFVIPPPRNSIFVLIFCYILLAFVFFLKNSLYNDCCNLIFLNYNVYEGKNHNCATQGSQEVSKQLYQLLPTLITIAPHFSWHFMLLDFLLLPGTLALSWFPSPITSCIEI